MAGVIVVDASCLYEVLVDTPRSEMIRERMAGDPDHVAPHLIDIEVFSLIRRDHLGGTLDATAAVLAVDDLRAWPAERYGHRALLSRAWDLRESVRSWDAVYVTLAEALDVTLITLDRRLARADGPRCRIELVG